MLLTLAQRAFAAVDACEVLTGVVGFGSALPCAWAALGLFLATVGRARAGGPPHIFIKLVCWRDGVLAFGRALPWAWAMPSKVPG